VPSTKATLISTSASRAMTRLPLDDVLPVDGAVVSGIVGVGVGGIAQPPPGCGVEPLPQTIGGVGVGVEQSHGVGVGADVGVDVGHEL
jgi:hypothetical protein